MTPAEYKARQRAAHLAEVTWWTFSEFGVTEHRAIYYLHRVAWKDHPWGKARGGGFEGADFVDHWALESRDAVGPYASGEWRPGGRTNDGWGALRFDRGDFPTKQEAIAAALLDVAATIERRTAQVSELRARQRQLLVAQGGG